jgi:hypothetical protein
MKLPGAGKHQDAKKKWRFICNKDSGGMEEGNPQYMWGPKVKRP